MRIDPTSETLRTTLPFRILGSDTMLGDQEYRAISVETFIKSQCLFASFSQRLFSPTKVCGCLRHFVLLAITVSVLFHLFVPSCCFASDILSAEYSTKYPLGDEKRFKSFDELVSFLSRYDKPVRNEFETEKQYKERVRIFENAITKPRRFTIYFTPSLGQYSHELQAFPVNISVFKGETAGTSWNSINTKKIPRVSVFEYNYSRTVGPCLISNWWPRLHCEINIKETTKSWMWSIKTQPVNLQLPIKDLSRAKPIRKHEEQLTARMDCIFLGEKWGKESKVHSEETGQWSSSRREGLTQEVRNFNVQYKLYSIEVERCIVQLGEQDFEVLPTNLNLVNESGKASRLKQAQTERMSEIATKKLREIASRDTWTWKEIMPWVRRGGDVNVLNNRGYTILHFAASYGYANDIPYLVKKGARVDAVLSRTTKTPLQMAIHKGHPKVAVALINAGANVNYERGSRIDRELYLFDAASKGQPSVIKALLRAGAKVDARRVPSFIDSVPPVITDALMMACRESRDAKTEKEKQGYVETVKILIQNGADVNARYNSSGTAFHTAISKTRDSFYISQDGTLCKPKPFTGASKEIYNLLREAGATK